MTANEVSDARPSSPPEGRPRLNTVVWVRIEPWPYWPALTVSREWAESQLAEELLYELPDATARNCAVKFFNYGDFIDVVDNAFVRDFCEHIGLLNHAGDHEKEIHDAAQEAIWWLLGSPEAPKKQLMALNDPKLRHMISEAGLKIEARPSPETNKKNGASNSKNYPGIDLGKYKDLVEHKQVSKLSRSMSSSKVNLSNTVKSMVDDKKDRISKRPHRNAKPTKKLMDSSSGSDQNPANSPVHKVSNASISTRSADKICPKSVNRRVDEANGQRKAEKKVDEQSITRNQRKMSEKKSSSTKMETRKIGAETNYKKIQISEDGHRDDNEPRQVSESSLQANGVKWKTLFRPDNSISVSRLPTPVPRRFKNRALQLKNLWVKKESPNKISEKKSPLPRTSKKRRKPLDVCKRTVVMGSVPDLCFGGYRSKDRYLIADVHRDTIQKETNCGLIEFKLMQVSNALRKLESEIQELELKWKSFELQRKRIKVDHATLKLQFRELRKLSETRRKSVKFS